MLINSLIGEHTKLKGEFELKGVLRIDGIFYGNIAGEGKVLIGENGESNGDITASVVIVGGKVKGNVIATEMISILSTGTLIGNIKTPRLIGEEGMVLDGNCMAYHNEELEIKTDEDAKSALKEAKFALKTKTKELIEK